MQLYNSYCGGHLDILKQHVNEDNVQLFSDLLRLIGPLHCSFLVNVLFSNGLRTSGNLRQLFVQHCSLKKGHWHSCKLLEAVGCQNLYLPI